MTLGAFSCAFAFALGEGGRPTPKQLRTESLGEVGLSIPSLALLGVVVGFGPLA